MAKQKQDKFTVTVTPEKPCPQKPFIQTEGELTPSAIGSDRGGKWMPYRSFFSDKQRDSISSKALPARY